MAPEISPKVAHFLVTNIDSVGELEALLLLHGQPDKRWTYREVADRLYTTEEQARAFLRKLCARGIASSDADNVQYQPADPVKARTIDEVVRIYPLAIVPVTNLIHKKGHRSIQELADAFKFNKEDDE